MGWLVIVLANMVPPGVAGFWDVDDQLVYRLGGGVYLAVLVGLPGLMIRSALRAVFGRWMRHGAAVVVSAVLSVLIIWLIIIDTGRSAELLVAVFAFIDVCARLFLHRRSAHANVSLQPDTYPDVAGTRSR